jgi:hypothetical protein
MLVINSLFLMYPVQIPYVPKVPFFLFQKTDEETTALRERIISIRRKVHKNTVSAVAERWNYEEGVSSIANERCNSLLPRLCVLRTHSLISQCL